jgi:hypothetical protein
MQSASAPPDGEVADHGERGQQEDLDEWLRHDVRSRKGAEPA